MNRYATPHDDILDDPTLRRSMLEKLEADAGNGCPAAAFSHWWIQIGSRIIDPVPGDQNENCHWWSVVAGEAWNESLDLIPGDKLKLDSWMDFKACAELIPQSYHQKVRWVCWRMYLRAAAIAQAESYWDNTAEDMWLQMGGIWEETCQAAQALSLTAWQAGYGSGDCYSLTMWAKWWNETGSGMRIVDHDADHAKAVAVAAFTEGMEMKWTGGAA
jgi:hypothetical protein